MDRSPNDRERSRMCEAVAFSRENDIHEASALIQELFWRGSLGRRMQDAQRKLGWGHNRVYEIFSGKARRVDAFEKDQLRALKAERDLKAARSAHAELTDLIAGMETLLSETDADFHSEQISALRNSRSEAPKGNRLVAGSRD